jgi:hypothetical protein
MHLAFKHFENASKNRWGRQAERKILKGENAPVIAHNIAPIDPLPPHTRISIGESFIF